MEEAREKRGWEIKGGWWNGKKKGRRGKERGKGETPLPCRRFLTTRILEEGSGRISWSGHTGAPPPLPCVKGLGTSHVLLAGGQCRTDQPPWTPGSQGPKDGGLTQPCSGDPASRPPNPAEKLQGPGEGGEGRRLPIPHT